MFHIKVLKEWCGPMYWTGLINVNHGERGSISDSYFGGEDDDDDGPPLLTAEDGGFGTSEGEEEVEGYHNSKVYMITRA